MIFVLLWVKKVRVIIPTILFTFQDGFKINVSDTVGAGDSFLATLVEGILNKTKPQEILKKACAVAALVASKRGATTKVSLTEINNLLGNK